MSLYTILPPLSPLPLYLPCDLREPCQLVVGVNALTYSDWRAMNTRPFACVVAVGVYAPNDVM